jgi:hypothetical protein
VATPPVQPALPADAIGRTPHYPDETITPIVNESGRITHFVAAGREIAAGERAAPVRRRPS